MPEETVACGGRLPMQGIACKCASRRLTKPPSTEGGSRTYPAGSLTAKPTGVREVREMISREDRVVIHQSVASFMHGLCETL